MKRNFLLPNYWKKIGVALALVALSLILIKSFNEKFNIMMPVYGEWSNSSTITNSNGTVGSSAYSWASQDVTETLIILLGVLGLAFTYFSKEKIEDELISKIRLDSLAWAVILNSILNMIARIATNDLFWEILALEINIFSILLIALFRHYYLKYRFSKSGASLFDKKDRYLLNHKASYLGWIIFIIAIILNIILVWKDYYVELLIPKYFDLAWNYAAALISGKSFLSQISKYDYINIYDTLVIYSTIVGLLLITFSKEKAEDEYISSLRLKALSLSVLVHYAYILIANFLVWGMEFLSIMTYAMYTPLVFYILYFNYLKYKMKRSLSNDHKIEGLCI
jgi:hypothetical protein